MVTKREQTLIDAIHKIDDGLEAFNEDPGLRWELICDPIEEAMALVKQIEEDDAKRERLP